MIRLDLNDNNIYFFKDVLDEEMPELPQDGENTNKNL
jgi:hypothetical protein